MLPNLKCGGVVVNEFRVMRGRKRGSFGERDRRFESAFLQRRVCEPIGPFSAFRAAVSDWRR
jgi:hypothetical protein